MAWIKAPDRMPEFVEGVKKFKVKMTVGSMVTSEQETEMLANNYPHGVMFNAGDWRVVTHWWEDEENEIN